LVLAALVARARPVERFTTLVRVTVAPGDTLWALARRYGGPDCYLPKAVYQIRQANRLPDSRLVPGQVLWIPVERTRRRPPAGGVLLARSRQPQ
jgi:LysM repeat protein